jgi:hypothetical protein
MQIIVGEYRWEARVVFMGKDFTRTHRRETHEGVSKSFRTELIAKYTTTKINTRWEATERVMAEKLTRLIHKIVIQLNLVTESCNICSSRSRRPVRNVWIHPRMLQAKCDIRNFFQYLGILNNAKALSVLYNSKQMMKKCSTCSYMSGRAPAVNKQPLRWGTNWHSLHFIKCDLTETGCDGTDWCIWFLSAPLQTW